MKSNNLHVALDDNQLLHLFMDQGGPLGGHNFANRQAGMFYNDVVA